VARAQKLVGYGPKVRLEINSPGYLIANMEAVVWRPCACIDERLLTDKCVVYSRKWNDDVEKQLEVDRILFFKDSSESETTTAV